MSAQVRADCHDLSRALLRLEQVCGPSLAPMNGWNVETVGGDRRCRWPLLVGAKVSADRLSYRRAAIHKR
jgi:hypothetical protein